MNENPFYYPHHSSRYHYGGVSKTEFLTLLNLLAQKLFHYYFYGIFFLFSDTSFYKQLVNFGRFLKII